MKREFELDVLTRSNDTELGAVVKIIGDAPKNKPYVKIDVRPTLNNPFPFSACVNDKDLELFAVNILKALNSKRVLQGKVPYHKRKK